MAHPPAPANIELHIAERPPDDYTVGHRDGFVKGYQEGFQDGRLHGSKYADPYARITWLHERVDALAGHLGVIAQGSWNLGRGKPISVNEYAREALKGNEPL